MSWNIPFDIFLAPLAGSARYVMNVYNLKEYGNSILCLELFYLEDTIF